MMKRMKNALPVAALAATVGLVGCGDVFDVTNPGRILDADLNTPEGINALVTGMSSDFSNNYDELSFGVARMTDEMSGSGSYNTTGLFRRGIIPQDAEVDFYYEGAQEARWVAEAGLLRMEGTDGFSFAGNPLTGRAYLYAGLANRWLGENFCSVTFSSPYESDDGSEQDRMTAFQRAIPHLNDAIANAGGDTEIETAARGALAQVYMGLGDFASAITWSAQVPTEFEFVAVYDANSGREENVIWNETHGRQEMSAFDALAGTVSPMDVRAPYQDCSTDPTGCNNSVGADGTTLFYKQLKYPLVGSDIPLVKGTEMRLIEAEAALVGADIPGMVASINEARAHYGLAPIDGGSIVDGPLTGDRTGTSMNSWDVLDRERHLTMWLEGRRLWDLERWDHPFLMGGSLAGYLAEDMRDSCIPISDSECQTNSSLSC
ncbi:MAG: RagB/SusD family nutrient uptake outer membrane protein [Gemmatimonadetes bacterium]|nr:RagB/SusD family nutrient uptake outer membrane protein [Gemmatimonadota bacterium]